MTGNFFEIAYFCGYLIGSALRGILTHPHRKEPTPGPLPTKTDRILMAVTSIGLFLPIIYLGVHWFDFAAYTPPPWIGYLGIAFFVYALWLLWRAHAALKGNWRPWVEPAQEHSLVTGGIFRRIRHPMYAAHMWWALAQAMLLQNWLVGPSFLILFLPLYFYRTRREEQLLLERYGREYGAYMERSGRILPPFFKRSAPSG